MRVLPFVLAAVLATQVAAQASYVTYGLGCNNRGIPPITTPTIYVRGLPGIGKTIEVGVEGRPRFSVHYQHTRILITGVSRTSYLGVPLPYRIDPWRMNYTGNCDFLCSMECFELVQSDLYRLDIPPEPRLIGAKLYHQWYIWYFVTGSFPDTFTILSNGGEMTIGV